MKECNYISYKKIRTKVDKKIILLRQRGAYEVTLQKDCFGFYLCRIWFGFEYVEAESKNKFTAYRNAKKLLK